MRRILFAGLAAALLIALALACGGDDGPTNSDDTTPPTITSTSPTDSAVGVAITTNVTATFSEPISNGTISAGSFTLTPDGGSAVTGAFTFSNNAVTMRPSADLAYETEYTARVTTAVTDQAGNNLAADYTWVFTTEIDPNSLPAEIVDVEPDSNAADVPVDVAPSVTFSKGMDPTTFTPSSLQLQDSTGAMVPGSVSYDTPSQTATFTPDDSLDFSARYEVTVASSVQDTFGIALGAAYT